MLRDDKLNNYRSFVDDITLSDMRARANSMRTELSSVQSELSRMDRCLDEKEANRLRDMSKFSCNTWNWKSKNDGYAARNALRLIRDNLQKDLTILTKQISDAEAENRTELELREQQAKTETVEAKKEEQQATASKVSAQAGAETASANLKRMLIILLPLTLTGLAVGGYLYLKKKK